MDLTTLLPAGLSLLESALPSLTALIGADKATFLSKAVTFVAEAAPIVAKEFKDLKPMVSNIIAVLKSDPSTYEAQLEALEEAEKALDADFDDAAAAALAEDAAATKSAT